MEYIYWKGGRTIWRYSVFANFLGGDTVIWIKNGRYSVFQSPNGDGKIQFLIENTTVTVFIQKFDYGITVIFEKINGNTVIQNLVRPPLYVVQVISKLISSTLSMSSDISLVFVQLQLLWKL